MNARFLSAAVLGLCLTSVVAVAASSQPSEFVGKVTPLSAVAAVAKSLKSAGPIPNYSIRVNNNSPFLIYATALDGYGGQKTFAVDPHYAATIQNYANPPYGYEIRIQSDLGFVVFDGQVSTLACVDVYEGVGGPVARVNNFCLQPY